ncbi:hypothetical protein AB1Y20_003626 [Prymnesium parvum]|uniref:Protein-serine/threonine phosphatase n=1 Tax=Prymnesium parvum TaxID=97485 RepID=A0AB34J592_PRYPA
MALVVAGDPLADERISATRDDEPLSEAAPLQQWPWLYVGSLAAAQDHAFLRDRRISRVLTLAPRLHVRRAAGVAYREVELEDHPSADLLATLPGVFAFIDEAQAAWEDASAALLVHCASGVSRSVSAVVAWLICRHAHSLVDALRVVRAARPQANPNVGFSLQLQHLEQQGADLAAAAASWSVRAGEGALQLAHARRATANELHARVDALEEQLQQLRASEAEGGGWRAAVRRELLALSARLDEERSGGQLAEDRVALTIFKAARSKLERLLQLL